jgi:hypothetical protein
MNTDTQTTMGFLYFVNHRSKEQDCKTFAATVLTGNTPDISEFLEYKWYQPVWYYEPTAFPEQRKHLARWIGVAHRVGQATAGFIETPFSVYQGISIRRVPLC